MKQEKAKFNNQDQTFVVAQRLKGNKEISNYELSVHLKQEENSYLFSKNWCPQLNAHYVGFKRRYLFFTPYDLEKTDRQIRKITYKYDRKLDKHATNPDRLQKLQTRKKKRINRKKFKEEYGAWYGRVFGETPHFFDSTKVNESQTQLKLFLQSKGFFSAKVNVEKKTNKKDRTTISYIINEGRPHKIDRVLFSIEDSTLKHIKEEIISKTYLEKDQNFDVDKITKERDRITNLFKNNGYYFFDKKHIKFHIDSTKSPYKITVDVLIQNPESQLKHTQYEIARVVYKEESPSLFSSDSLVLNDIIIVQPYSSRGAKRVLNNQIKVRKGDLYSLQNAQLTQRLLSNLNSFKFVNINYQKVDSNKLFAYINTSNMKKYGLVAEGGVNVNINQEQGLPGPFVSASWISRRFLKGYELFELSGLFSLERQPNIADDGEAYQTRELGVKIQITFPKFLFPFTKSRLFWKSIPQTKLTFRVNDIDRVEYNRILVNGGLNYYGIWGKYGRWHFSFFDVSVIQTRRLSSSFSDYLEELKQEGNNLFQSFNPGIINNIKWSYLYNNNDITLNKNSKYYYFGIEFGGPFYTIGRVLNTKYGDNSLTENELFGIPYYEYTKVSIDLRKYLPVSKSSSFNFRLNSGIAVSYNAKEDLTLPYEKFYFAGGLNSIRAWQARRLGPGSYAYQDQNGTYSYQFEQPGEIILEGFVEYRTKLFAFIQGAAFIDIGNIWTIEPDPARPGAEFKASSIPKEIALGTGLGLRLDFSFLIVRWDVGVKMWDPARQTIPEWSDKDKIVHNIGIGYPF